jgi:DNA-directed RNA polymerase beta' subunit
MVPSPLNVEYCVATSRDIRSWSFGALTVRRHSLTTFSDNLAGTLNDQRIFGPIEDYKCACGKHFGDQHKNMICDRCGVKVASSVVRASRFGHVDFHAAVPHPFIENHRTECFPVLPILFLESLQGHALIEPYENLIEAAVSRDLKRVQELLVSITNYLLPVAITAYGWKIAAAETFARGMALKHKDSIDDSRNSCDHCGYLISGLEVVLCPGCGCHLQKHQA